MANELIFKGIQQVKALPTNPEKGVIYFVREHENDVATGNAKVYFGGRLYGEVATTQLANLHSAITANTEDIRAIEALLGDFRAQMNDNIKTVAQVTKANADAIEKLNGNGDGSVAKAVADAKSELLGDVGTNYNTLGKLEDEIQKVAQSVTDKNVDATGDAYVSATAAGNKVTVAATDSTKASLALADTALQESGITTGGANGTIAVNGNDVAVKGLGSAAYTDAGAYDAKGAAADALTAATKYTDDEIAKLNANVTGESNDKLVKVEVVEENGKLTNVNVTTTDIAKNSDLTAHTGNTTVHITADERAAWDAAKSDIDAFLKGEAISGTTVDTLKEIQNFITSEGQAAADMLNAISSAQTAADAAQSDVDTLEGLVGAGFTTDKTVASEIARVESAITEAINDLGANVTGESNDKLVKVEVVEENGKLTSVVVTTDDIAKNSDLTVHTGNTTVHITADERTAWNAAEGNAKGYTDTEIAKLSEVYDSKGAAAAVQTNLEAYSGATKTVLDDIESRLTAITNSAVTSVVSSGKTISVTDNVNGEVNVEVNRLAHGEGQDGYVILNATENGALYGVMYYGGDDVE